MKVNYAKYSKIYFEKSAAEIPEIKFIFPFSDNEGSVQLFVYLNSDNLDENKIAEDLVEKADLRGFFHCKSLQIVFLKSSATRVIK